MKKVVEITELVYCRRKAEWREEQSMRDRQNGSPIFSVDEDLNLVVMRGVFNTGGYGISIEHVERQANVFTVYATYTDPGEGMVVTQAFTQPTAIIPVGKLASGDYKAVLKVTRMIQSAEGEKVIETEKKVKSLEFKVE